LIDEGGRLGRFSLNFEYFKIAENEYNKGELLRIKNIVSYQKGKIEGEIEIAKRMLQE